MSSNYYFNIKANDQTSTAFNAINQNLIRMDKQSIKANRSMGAFKSQKGTMQQLGYQVQDVAVQLQMGTNALVVFGQQGSQILGMFGPGGAMVGALLAVGAALGTAFLPQMFNSKKAVDELSEAMDKLREVATKGDDGIFQFTKAIQELGQVGNKVVGAELEASLIRAQNSSKAAAKSITESLTNGIDTSMWFNDIDESVDLVSELSEEFLGSIGTFRDAANSIGKEFGKSGDQAFAFGKQVIVALNALENTPSAEGFNQLQQLLSDAASSGANVSNKIKLMVSDLKLFFAEARSAAETFEFLTQKLDELNQSGSVELGGEKALSAMEQKSISLAQQLLIAKANMEGNTLEAQKLSTAFDLGLESAAQLPAEIKNLVEQLFQVKQAQQENHDAKMQQLAAQRQAQSQANTEQRILEGLQSQIILLEQGKEAQEEFNIRKQLGLEIDQQIPEAIQAQIDKLNELRGVQEEYGEESQTFWESMRGHIENTTQDFDVMWGNTFDRFTTGIAQATTEAILAQQNFGDAAKEIAKGAIKAVIQGLIELGIKKLALFALEKTILAGSTTANIAAASAQGLASASAWAPAAAFASLATGGANAIPASAALTATVGLAEGLALAGSFEGGGHIPDGPRSGGVDNRGGMYAIVHPDETIIDNKKQRRSEGLQINFNPVFYGNPDDAVFEALERYPKKIGRIVQAVMQTPY